MTTAGADPGFGCFNDAEFNEKTLRNHLASYPWLAFAYSGIGSGSCRRAYLQTITLAASRRGEGRESGFDRRHFSRSPNTISMQLSPARTIAATEPRKASCNISRALRAHHSWRPGRQNCPENFSDRAALIGAEIARIERRDLEASASMRRPSAPPVTTASFTTKRWRTKRASRFFFDRGRRTTVWPIFARPAPATLAGAPRQGAPDRSALSATGRGQGARAGATTGSAAEQLDAAALVKASQAVFGEIDLPRLIETLMTITLQSAGADRGLLLLSHEGGFVIEAEACARGPASRCACAVQP